MLIFISCKGTATAKRILKIMLITSNHNNMGNAKKKTVNHIPKPKLRVGQYLLLFDIRYYLKISLTCSKFLI